MTLLEIQNQLVNFFAANATFNVKKDIRKISVSKDQEKAKTEIVSTVLEHLCGEKFCQKVDNQDGDILYILISPLSSRSQSVSLNNSTANVLTQIITQYNLANENLEYTPDSLGITDNDIRNVCIICAQLMQTIDDMASDDPDEETK